MVEASARLEGRAIPTRHGKGHVLEVNHAVDAADVPAVADANAPGTPIRVAADGAKFAQVGHRALKAFIAQHVRYGVGDEALGNAVQRNGHAGAREPD